MITSFPGRDSFLQEQSCDWEEERKYISSLPLDWIKAEISASRGTTAICGQFAKELSDTLNIPAADRAVIIPTRTEVLLSLEGKRDVGIHPVHPSSLADTLPKTDTLVITSPALGAFLVENPAFLSKLAYQIDRLLLVPCLMPPSTIMATWGATTTEMGTPEYPAGRFCTDPTQPALLSLMNYRGESVSGVLHFNVYASGSRGICRLQITCAGRSHELEFDNIRSINLALTLAPGITELEFRWLGPIIKDPSDKEVTSFALRELDFTDSSGASLLSDKWAYTERTLDPVYCRIDEAHIRSAIHQSGFNEVSGCMAGRISDRPVRVATTRRTHANFAPYYIDQGEGPVEPRSYFDVIWFSAYRLPQHISLTAQKKHG